MLLFSLSFLFITLFGTLIKVCVTDTVSVDIQGVWSAPAKVARLSLGSSFPLVHGEEAHLAVLRVQTRLFPKKETQECFDFCVAHIQMQSLLTGTGIVKPSLGNESHGKASVYVPQNDKSIDVDSLAHTADPCSLVASVESTLTLVNSMFDDSDIGTEAQQVLMWLRSLAKQQTEFIKAFVASKRRLFKHLLTKYKQSIVAHPKKTKLVADMTRRIKDFDQSGATIQHLEQKDLLSNVAQYLDKSSLVSLSSVNSRTFASLGKLRHQLFAATNECGEYGDFLFNPSISIFSGFAVPQNFLFDLPSKKLIGCQAYLLKSKQTMPHLIGSFEKSVLEHYRIKLDNQLSLADVEAHSLILKVSGNNKIEMRVWKTVDPTLFDRAFQAAKHANVKALILWVENMEVLSNCTTGLFGLDHLESLDIVLGSFSSWSSIEVPQELVEAVTSLKLLRHISIKEQRDLTNKPFFLPIGSLLDFCKVPQLESFGVMGQVPGYEAWDFFKAMTARGRKLRHLEVHDSFPVLLPFDAGITSLSLVVQSENAACSALQGLGHVLVKLTIKNGIGRFSDGFMKCMGEFARNSVVKAFKFRAFELMSRNNLEFVRDFPLLETLHLSFASNVQTLTALAHVPGNIKHLILEGFDFSLGAVPQTIRWIIENLKDLDELTIIGNVKQGQILGFPVHYIQARYDQLVKDAQETAMSFCLNLWSLVKPLYDRASFKAFNGVSKQTYRDMLSSPSLCKGYKVHHPGHTLSTA